MKAPAGYHWMKPRLLPSLFVLGAVLVLFGLGTWQMQRLAWKERLIAELSTGAERPPLAGLPKDPAQLAQMQFKRITLHGHFLNDHEFHLAGRYVNATLGYHILTPFQLDDGRIVVLNRGWVPAELKEPAKRAAGIVNGPVTLTAMIRTDSDRNTFTPDADPAKNLWFWHDVDGMRKASGLPLEPITLDVINMKVPGGYPQASDGNIMLRNDHLGYAITWYSLCVAAAVIFVLTHLKPDEPVT